MTIHSYPTPATASEELGRNRSCHPAGTARLTSVPDPLQRSDTHEAVVEGGLFRRLDVVQVDLFESSGRAACSPGSALYDLATGASTEPTASTVERLIRLLEELADPEVRPWLLTGNSTSGGPVQLTLL